MSMELSEAKGSVVPSLQGVISLSLLCSLQCYSGCLWSEPAVCLPAALPLALAWERKRKKSALKPPAASGFISQLSTRITSALVGHHQAFGYGRSRQGVRKGGGCKWKRQGASSRKSCEMPAYSLKWRTARHLELQKRKGEDKEEEASDLSNSPGSTENCVSSSAQQPVSRSRLTD
ncbi:uncharacterized protein LOC141954386 isoform X2 [Strix uralensis]|uniref:uncharacterized protein LOC141954386 isoform X2 n=1 Tax=Strix uralensis TaxID=36305 RepID=UPI003DA6F0FC